MKVLSVIAMTLALLSLPGQPTATAADDIQVTWPSVTRFNPDLTTYTFQVNDDGGAGELRLQALNEPYADWTSIPHSGDVTWDVNPSWMTGSGTLRVYRCEGECTVIAESPALEFYRELTLQTSLGGVYGPTDSPVLATWVAPSDEPVEVSWFIVPHNQPHVTPLASGVVTVTELSQQHVLPTLTGFDSGAYDLHASGVVDHPDFGHLEQTASVRQFRVDADAEVSFKTRYDPVIYPAFDRYLDRTYLGLRSKETLYSPKVSVIDDNGAVVAHQLLPKDWFWGRQIVFSGRNGGEILPEGNYRLVFRGEDGAGNVATATSKPIKVLHDELTELTFRRTYKATRTVTDTLVGKCSRLSTPSTHGWKGSLGYLSQTKCKKPAQSVVATMSGVYVPKLHGGPSGYGRLRVTLFGGAAQGAHYAYINMGLLARKKNRLEDNTSFPGKLGPHSISSQHGFEFVRDPEGQPYILWQTGLTAGSRYDVKSFTVELNYTDLR